MGQSEGGGGGLLSEYGSITIGSRAKGFSDFLRTGGSPFRRTYMHYIQ